MKLRDWIIIVIVFVISSIIGSIIAFGTTYILEIKDEQKDIKISISKTYLSGNHTFQSIEPEYKIELNKGESFSWDNWLIEVK